MVKHQLTSSAKSRLPLVDALRAVVATLVAWHHFVLYGLLSGLVLPLPDRMIDLLRNHRSIVQVFFVVGGYVMAYSMSRRPWNCRHVGWFVVRRYCRLGLPYLGAVALAIGACAIGRGWISERVVGSPPTLAQILAHVAFLQDILGYDSLSAGLWFVCIDFQLGLVYVVLLYLRDAIGPVLGRARGEDSTVVFLFLGFMLAVPSLFFFNLHDRFSAWAVYFFGQFFLGVMVYHGLQGSRLRSLFGLYVLTIVAALAYSWRWRLATSLATGLILFVAGHFGVLERWPKGRIAAYLGRTSYSLFLIHFSVLVVVLTLWVRFDWIAGGNSSGVLVVAYIASLIVADAFFRIVEIPAVTISRKFT